MVQYHPNWFFLGMAMGQGRAKGWGLWPPHGFALPYLCPAQWENFFCPIPAPWGPAKPHLIL